MEAFEQLSREELVDLVRLQAEEIATLKQEVQALRDLLQGRGPGNGLPPFVKANRKKREPGERKVRKKRSRAFVRKREKPTREVPHAVENCPDCGRKLEGGWEHSRHQVLELPEAPVEIIDHVLIRRRCGVCGTLHLPTLGPQDGVLGQHRVGPRLMSLIAALCTDYRVPKESVQRFLQSLYGVHLSVGEIINVLHAVADRGKGEVAAILGKIRRAPFVHADETGLREDGVNGYVWSFSTPTERYFYRDKSRAAQVAKGVLLGEWPDPDKEGAVRKEECEPFTGVLVCDFYSAYTWYEGPRQRCWDHLSRELKDLREKHAEDPAVVDWVGRVFTVYDRAKQVAARDLPEAVRRQWRRKLEADLLAIAKPYLQDESLPQNALAGRIDRFQSELFVFVQYPGVPPGNNAAERALRPTVIARKISGGTRSSKGSETLAALRTLFGTWALNGKDTVLACIELLTGTRQIASLAPT